jgi:PEP-CTERM motif
MMKKVLLMCGLMAAFSMTGSAIIVGSQGFADIGPTTCNTGDINTCTVFNLGNMVTTASQSGAFVGLPIQFTGPAVVDLSNPSSFVVNDPTPVTGFGSFTSFSITEISNVPGAVAIYILGLYTNTGTFTDPPNVVNEAASFTLSFTQTPASTGAISASGTFADPPAGAPEPASMALLGSALIGLGMIGRKRFAR